MSAVHVDSPVPELPPQEAPELRRQAAVEIVRLLVGFVVLGVAIGIVSAHYRAPLERMGTWFVARSGAVGMGAGAFLADAIHFPIPPQFYLFAGVAGGFDRGLVFASVLVGSILGGLVAFEIGRRAVAFPRVHRWFERPKRAMERVLARHPSWGLIVVSLLPFSYCLIAAAAGALELPYRAYGVIGLMRVPRLLFTYVALLLAWNASGG